MVVIYLTFTVCIAASARSASSPASARARGPRVASEGAIDAFEALGPTFVKLGQLIASSPGHLPGAAVERRAALPRRGAALRRRDRPRDDPQGPRPRAVADLPALRGVAAVGGVDRPGARLRAARRARGGRSSCSGPNIRERMTTDLRIMHRLGSTLQKHTKLGQERQPRRRRATTSTPTRSRSSTRRSRRSGRTASATDISAFGDNTYITAPEVYWDYCGPHMICMERMSGVPMDDFAPIAERGVDGFLIAAARREGVARGGGGARLLPRRRARRQPLGARRRPGHLPRLRDHGRGARASGATC